jgi:hypothetical protein
MTIHFTLIERIGSSAWKFEWAVSTAPYRVFLDGLQHKTVDAATVTIDLPGYTDYPPSIEVLDDTMEDVEATSVAYPNYVTLQWVGVSTAAYYSIQYYEDSIWTQLDIVREIGAGYYIYRTSRIDNDESAQWRIVPIDTQGNQGTPSTFTFSVVGLPTSPTDVSHEYSGGSIQIGA